MAAAAPSTAAAAPSLVRLCVAQDGRVKANFSDNSVLLLNAAGSAFLYNTSSEHDGAGSSGGSSIRQLSEYALLRHTPQLALVLEFRNMHLDQPFFCKPLLKAAPGPGKQHQQRGCLSLGYRLREVHWPATAQEAVEAGLVARLPDGRTSLSAQDGSARMVLHFYRRRFAVCYPLLVEERAAEGVCNHVWHSQAFSLQGYPARWQPAVELLLEAAQLLDRPECSAALQPTTSGQLEQQQQHQEQLHGTDADAERRASHAHASSSGSPGAVHGPHDMHGGGQRYDSGGGNSSTGGPDAVQAADQLPASSGGPAALVLADPYQQHHSRPPARTTPLPEATDRGLGGVCDSFPKDSWWFEPTLTLMPNDEVIVLEWTPSATYQFHPLLGEVEVWVHADESCLSSVKQGRFVCHTRAAAPAATAIANSSIPADGAGGPGAGAGEGSGPGIAEQLYAANCVPETVWVHPPSAATDASAAAVGKAPARYPLGQFAAHALRFREQMCSVLASQARPRLLVAPPQGPSRRAPAAPTAMPPQPEPASVEASFGVLSDQVVEHQEAPGQGSFTAYADGRVRATFPDRAILHLNGAHTHCKVFLPDGKSVTVSTANPVGVEGYAQAVLEFARWAFKSHEERAAEMRAQALIRAQVAASQRMAAILDYASSRRLPSGVMPATPGGAPALLPTSPARPLSAAMQQPLPIDTGHPTAMPAHVMQPVIPAPLEDDLLKGVSDQQQPSVAWLGMQQGLQPAGSSSYGHMSMGQGSSAGHSSGYGPHSAGGQGAAARALGPEFSVHASMHGAAGRAAGSMQDMVESLLQQNASLLRRLG